jgi:hypothetical protein
MYAVELWRDATAEFSMQVQKCAEVIAQHWNSALKDGLLQKDLANLASRAGEFATMVVQRSFESGCHELPPDMHRPPPSVAQLLLKDSGQVQLARKASAGTHKQPQETPVIHVAT